MPWNVLAIAGAIVAATIVAWIAMVLRRRPGDSLAGAAEERAGLLLASPWLVGFAIFMAFPIAMSLVLSLAKWNGMSTLGEASFVGFDNYRELLVHDRRMHTSLRVTAYYALLAVPLGQIVALAAALLLNAKVPLIGTFRAALYLPSVLAGVGTAVLWRWVFDGENGLMNAAARAAACAVRSRAAAVVRRRRGVVRAARLRDHEPVDRRRQHAHLSRRPAGHPEGSA